MTEIHAHQTASAAVLPHRDLIIVAVIGSTGCTSCNLMARGTNDAIYCRVGGGGLGKRWASCESPVKWTLCPRTKQSEQTIDLQLYAAPVRRGVAVGTQGRDAIEATPLRPLLALRGHQTGSGLAQSRQEEARPG